MKIKYIVAIAVITAILTTIAVIPKLAKGSEVLTVTVVQPRLSPAQIIWLARLMQCESGIRANAVNPNDLDNTPSYGILQFKPSTFYGGVKAFGLSTTTPYTDAETQVAIVEQWILLGGVRWEHQFPGCTSKLGTPPQNKGSQSQ